MSLFPLTKDECLRVVALACAMTHKQEISTSRAQIAKTYYSYLAGRRP
jgi:hypothetical protein